MMTEAELQAYSSPGLIRRAKKSLSKSDLKFTDTSSTNITFMFEDQIGVIYLKNITESQCDCPASGICKHIIAAFIDYSLHKSSEEILLNPNLELENYLIPIFNQEQLTKVKNKAAWRNANKLFSSGELYESHKVITKFDHCIVLWGTNSAVIGKSNDVNAIVLDNDSGLDKKLISALLIEMNQGREIEWPIWLIEENIKIINEKKENLLTIKLQIKQILKNLILIGPVNLESTNLIDLTNLIPKLRTLGLRYISNTIKALNEQVALRSENKGTDHNIIIINLIANIYKQCDASLDLIVSDNKTIKSLKLFCIGAHQWETDSGMCGLTIVFQSDTGVIHHTTISRPINTAGFSISETWRTYQLWENSPIINQLIGKSFQLNNIEFNQWGGISLKKDTKYVKIEDNIINNTPIIDWQELKEIENYGYAILKPNKWIGCEFDEKLQELRLLIEDKQGFVLTICQPYNKSSEHRITTLIELWQNKPEYIVVRHRFYQSEHIFEPVIVFRKNWISLDFESEIKVKKGLFKRIVDKISNHNTHLPIQKKEGLDLILLRIQDLLCEYPVIEEFELKKIQEQLNLFGLNQLSNMLFCIKNDQTEYLKLCYLIERLKIERAKWPIY
ncbi:MAG: SWIM zinc finger domain-containing protein [Pseudomonadales bacterium]|nr:SWIM zinc finger domain-containing protein [Pseudomonadales bacterium]